MVQHGVHNEFLEVVTSLVRVEALVVFDIQVRFLQFLEESLELAYFDVFFLPPRSQSPQGSQLLASAQGWAVPALQR